MTVCPTQEKQAVEGANLQKPAKAFGDSSNRTVLSLLNCLTQCGVAVTDGCEGWDARTIYSSAESEKRQFHAKERTSHWIQPYQTQRLWNDRSYAMKLFCTMLALMLPAIPVAGMAQTAPAQVPQATSAPATSTPPPAAGQSPAAAASPKVNYSGPMDPTRYTIGPEDSLQITVWKEPTLSGTIPVRPDGMISLALIGDMPAAGQTPMALSNDISQRLKKYIQDPVVTVVVLGVTSQRIFMVGEVGHIAPLALTPGMTPLQAIIASGGLTQFANSKKIYILRGTAGKQQKIPFNYKKALKGEDQGPALVPGDTIVIP